MILTGDIYNYIDSFAPFQSAMSFDNAGLLVGDSKVVVKTVVLSLDITPAVVREAAQLGAQLIISHHPVIFNPLKCISTDTAPYLLAQHGITAICAHTNLDMATGGVNSCLAECLELKNVRMLKEYETSDLPEALLGETSREYTPREFAEYVKSVLHCDGLRYTDGGQTISRVGLCGGGGAEFMYFAAEQGCQAFVTGESKHNILLDAENEGVTLVDAGHFYTEEVVIQPLLKKLEMQFPNICFIKSKQMHSPAKYL